MKMHLNLGTRDIARSVRFYSTLFDAVPSKHADDYALFVLDDPGLELALDLDGTAAAPAGQHFGIAVATARAVEEQIARLEAEGYATAIEREATCCYANQTKVWATDPDGRRWETYVVHGETERRNDVDSGCCAREAAPAGCCP